MSGGANNRTTRATRRFTTEQLAELTRKAQEAVDRDPRPTGSAADPALSRTSTLEDPLTSELLAQVARQSETLELDDDVVEEVVHPHTRRRKP